MNICYIGVLLTDFNHGEGIPNTTLEFAALGKPMIVSLGGGNEEIIGQNNTGYIVGNGLSNQLKKKILHLIGNEKKIRIGNNGRKMVEKKFSNQNMISLFHEVYTKS